MRMTLLAAGYRSTGVAFSFCGCSVGTCAGEKILTAFAANHFEVKMAENTRVQPLMWRACMSRIQASIVPRPGTAAETVGYKYDAAKSFGLSSSVRLVDAVLTFPA